jgi:hypothetical protein
MASLKNLTGIHYCFCDFNFKGSYPQLKKKFYLKRLTDLCEYCEHGNNLKIKLNKIVGEVRAGTSNIIKITNITLV